MKLKSILQGYLVITLLLIHLLLIFKFVSDFTGFASESTNTFYKLATIFSKPFENTFEPLNNGEFLYDPSTIFAFIFYGIIFIFLFNLIKNIFSQNYLLISKSFAGIFFKIILIFYFSRLIFSFFKTENSFYLNLQNNFTNLLVNILFKILPVNFKDETATKIVIVFSIIIIIALWVLVNKLLELIFHEEENIPTQKNPIPIQKIQPVTETQNIPVQQPEIKEKRSKKINIIAKTKTFFEKIETKFEKILREDSKPVVSEFDKTKKKNQNNFSKSPLEN